ncbi:DMT family transporter [Aminirod propionatiphilus]|uniref:DMT family transporter n=1 Tax=Aminirod propionatiphilus TaxID=3415223 RepID=A0ACD1DVH5_9BACT|nr:DMT family transporter [Synergistota bacterium]
MDKKLSSFQTLVADGAMVLIALVWGGGYPVTDYLLQHLSPLWVLAFRFSISSVLLTLLFHRRLARLERSDLFGGALVGLLVALLFLCHVWGLKLSTPGKQAFIAGTNVVIVPFLFALIYRRLPSSWALAGATATTAGLLVMAFSPGMRFNAGDALSAAMAFLIALHFIAIGFFSRRMDPLALTVIQIDVACLVLVLSALAVEPFPGLRLALPLWGAILFVSLGATVLAFLVQTVAQRYTPETHAAILLSLESPFGFLLAIAMGRDQWNAQFALGGLLVLVGVLLAEWESLATTGPLTKKLE